MSSGTPPPCCLLNTKRSVCSREASPASKRVKPCVQDEIYERNGTKIFQSFTPHSSAIRTELSPLLLKNYYPRTMHLLNLPDNIKEQIFSYIIPTDNKISPLIPQGSLAIGLYYTSWDDELITQHKNIDASLLRVNKSLNETSQRLLYERNEFVFTNASLFYWWLKRIGDTNIAHVRKLKLYFGVDPQLGLCTQLFRAEEEVWIRAVRYLRDTHDLDEIKLNFSGWRDRGLTNNALTMEASILRRERIELIHQLAEVNGLQTVIVQQPRTALLSPQIIHQMDGLMRHTRQPRPSPDKTGRGIPLKEAVRQLRERRLEQEAARQEVIARRQRIAKLLDFNATTGIYGDQE